MPKYRDKMRLRRYKLKHGTVDSFTEYLILAGYSYDVARQGLSFFVENWAKAVEYYKNTLEELDPPVFGLCSEEFVNDLVERTDLYHLFQKASRKMQEEVQEELDDLDRIFRKATIKYDDPFSLIADPDPKEHWWLYRIPLDGLH